MENNTARPTAGNGRQGGTTMVKRLAAVAAIGLWLAGCESLPTPAKNIDNLDATLVPILQAGPQ